MTSEEKKIDAIDRLLKEGQARGLNSYLAWSTYDTFIAHIERPASWYSNANGLVEAIDKAIGFDDPKPCERPCSWDAAAVLGMFEEIRSKKGDIRLYARFAETKGYIFHVSINYHHRAYAHCAEEALFKAYEKWCKAEAK